MILIRCSNIEKVKKIHKAYFDTVVKEKLEKYISDKKENQQIVDFVKEFFFVNGKINEKLLEDICFGEKDKLDEVINILDKPIKEYEKKSGSYIFEKCIGIIEGYKKYLANDGDGKEENRIKEWNRVVTEIERILKKDKNEKILIKKDELVEIIKNEKIKIQNYNKTITTGDSYTFKFTNKVNIRKYINGFNKHFKEKNTLADTIQKIFDYKKFCNCEEIKVNNNEVIWNRHQLIASLGVTVCPYCNRQFVNAYIENDCLKTTADLDHYYSQKEYPYLALSLYNFIPSCQICNSRFKAAKNFHDEPHLYPYKEEFGDIAKFKTAFYGDEDKERKESKEKLEEEDRYDINYLMGNSNNFKLQITVEEPESEIGRKIENAKSTFHLEDLYNSHKDYVSELIKKAIVYNESRIDELYSQYPDLFSSREEIVQMVVSNYICEEDLGKRPLAKLTKDICEELGLK